MTGSVFSEVTWHGVRIEGGDWSYCNLRYAELSRVNFRDANLRDADCYQANLSGGCFQGADLSRAIFTQANIKGADLRGAVLTGIDFWYGDSRWGAIGLRSGYFDCAFPGSADRIRSPKGVPRRNGLGP